MDDIEHSNPRSPMRLASWAQGHVKRIVLVIGLLLLALWALRGYLPALGGSLLPPPVLDSIERGYQVCITDIVIWPGETRQPSCGVVRIVSQSAGIVDQAAKDAGIARCVCYQVDISNPYWTTERTTRHEVVWRGRRVSKVAILQHGIWVLFPDVDVEDAARWTEFSCTGQYEAGATPDANPG